MKTWTPATNVSDAFVLDFDIAYPEDAIFYRTGFFELVKWAWIQYLSAWIVVQYFVWKIYEFLIVNRMVNTIVEEK